MPADVLDDLEAEEDELDALLAPVADAAWETPTPAEGWTVRDQIAHLAFSEELASLAATDRDAFGRRLQELLGDLEQAERGPAERARGMAPAELLDWWRTARRQTVAALRAHDTGDRVPWVTGDMSLRSFATARLMETWAHGQDVVDALGLDRPPTARLRHIAHLGVSTRGFSYAVRGRTPPVADIRVELRLPDDGTWTSGPEDAANWVSGDAEDFALLVTQRRHLDDTGLTVTGRLAAEWLSIAQAFAGPPTQGRQPSRAGARAIED